jgi:hypothetical protein
LKIFNDLCAAGDAQGIVDIIWVGQVGQTLLRIFSGGDKQRWYLKSWKRLSKRKRDFSSFVLCINVVKLHVG